MTPTEDQPKRFTNVPGRSALALVVLAAAIAAAPAATIAEFDARFLDETLRVNYFNAGDAGHAQVSLDQVYRQGILAGSRTRLVDDLNLGRCAHHLYDHETGELLSSRGFDSYFDEYQTTGPASRGVWRTFHETALLPCPKEPADFALLVRDDDQQLREIFRVTIDPEHWSVRREPQDEDVIVVHAHESGDPHGKVDVAILGEGYTRAEVGKFLDDVQHFTAVLLGQEPFAAHAGDFNVWGVLAVSQDNEVNTKHLSPAPIVFYPVTTPRSTTSATWLRGRTRRFRTDRGPIAATSSPNPRLHPRHRPSCADRSDRPSHPGLVQPHRAR